MNAYELAEQAEGLAYEIPADWSSGEPKNIATDIANMLRQQADRIKDLEKLLEHSVGADCREMRYIQEIENKDARIAELVHMNKNWQLSETMAYNRIAELEKDLAKYDELAIDDLEGRRIIWCDCGDAITQDSGAVCGVCASFRSTKEQSAEPVAWIKKDTLIFLGNYEFGSITIQVQKKKDDEFDIPLYTAPKELSDEEIYKLAGEFWIEGSFDDGELDYVGFARAILKKASEKWIMNQ